MACVYPPGCLQNITITDPTSLDGSGLLEISLIPTRGVTDINVFSKKGLLHMKEMLEGADEEMDLSGDAGFSDELEGDENNLHFHSA